MRWAAAIVVLVLSGVAAAESSPPKQSLVFYNARLALREDRPNDVLKLWLLRNSLAQRGERSSVDPEFRSVVWAALGKLGLCQDGFPEDASGGAGLWPLALHNQVVVNLAKGPPPSNPAPWDVFEIARQQRFVSLQDVLSAEELRSVTFFRTGCFLPFAAAMQAGSTPFIDLQDRLSVGLLLKRLLELSRSTVVTGKVQNVSVVEARLFDLDLAISDLQGRQARRNGRALAQRARGMGVSAAGAAEMRDTLGRFPERSAQAAFLRKSLTWTPREWMALNPQRRLFLFAQARPLAQDRDALTKLEHGIIDALIAKGQGDELESWLGFLDAGQDPEARTAAITGERGKRMLELERDHGFRERAVIALHRGVAFLESGELKESLRAFAFALQHAEDSREATTTAALARRWLSYVLSRYETNEEVVATLKALVPRREYNAVIEDLIWRAALRADRGSFERISRSVNRGGSLDARIERLRLLAEGHPGQMATQLRDALVDEPSSVLRFVRALLENVESEDAQVRRANIPTVKAVVGILRPLTETADGKNKSQSRLAGELVEHAQSILDGLEQLDDSVEGNARALSLRHSTSAGSIRLAPADPLPWPFRAPEPESPSVFTPLVLEPVEWRDGNGRLVFGWRITE